MVLISLIVKSNLFYTAWCVLSQHNAYADSFDFAADDANRFGKFDSNLISSSNQSAVFAKVRKTSLLKTCSAACKIASLIVYRR